MDGRPKNEPFGTAFFVLAPDRPDLGEEWVKEKAWLYVVTARHCIEEVPTDTIYVRVNTSKGVVDRPTKKDDWFRHDSADVATIYFDLTDSQKWSHSFYAVAFPYFVERDCTITPGPNTYLPPADKFVRGRRLKIQLGDDLFFPGLFVQSAGTAENLPIARFGNISRMPSDELIALESKARGKIKIRAYLAESHSWGGHSGSPVFWIHNLNLADEIKDGDGKIRPVMVDRTYIVAFLGLVSAHFDIPMEAIPKPEQSEKSAFITKLNSGMAVVTPAEDVRELLMREDVMEDRNIRRAVIDDTRRDARAT